MNDFFLSLGSNIDPELNLPAAIRLLAVYGQIAAASTVWETQPVGDQDQPNYLNAVVHLQSEISAADFQDTVIPVIENRLGRIRSKNKFSPRSIDIDIMLYNHEILNLGHRHIPSPEIYQRAFVAIPLAEIAPDFLHPETGEPLGVIARKFQKSAKAMNLRPDVQLWI